MPTILANPELTSGVIRDLSRQSPPPNELVIAVQMKDVDASLGEAIVNAIDFARGKIASVQVNISDEFGLSHNRNIALALCTSDIFRVSR